MSTTRPALGVDVGGTNVRAALVSARGKILRRVSQPVGGGRAGFVAMLAGMSRQLGCDEASSIGVGLPGRVDARANAVISAGYLDIAGLPVAELLCEATGLPVFIENDCAMALVAEMAVGAAAGQRDVVMLTIGTGIGGAIAMDGRLLRGAAFAGQLGHVTVDIDGEVCRCGRRGCVETMSSGTALTRHLVQAGRSPGTTPRELLDAAAAGDAAAVALLRRWVRPLRSAIDSLIAAVDPAIVLLGGGLGGAAYESLAYAPSASSWYQRPVRPAALGDDAGMIGAALRAQHILDGTMQAESAR